MADNAPLMRGFLLHLPKIEIPDFESSARNEKEIVVVTTFPTSDDAIGQNQDSRRVRKF